MKDEIIIQNFQQLSGVMEQNMALMAQRLDAMMEILEDISPGSKDQFDKRMFKNAVMGLHLAKLQAREAGRLDIMQRNNEALTAMKKQAKEQEGYLQVFLHAIREADHLVEKPAIEEKGGIIEIPGQEC